jgi:GT2 family glycosyltransferase
VTRDVPLAAAVVAYGPPTGLARCLAALEGCCPVTVVDNASDPEAAAVAAAAGADYLDPGSNLGFAAGVNRALQAIGPGHDVLLVNPDAAVGPEAVAALRRALTADPSAACAAPRLSDPESGAAERVCWPFPTPARSWGEALGLGRFQRSCEYLIGAVLLLRAEALAQVGPFDERFFLYAEEADWQQRARRAGWRPVCVDGAAGQHQGAGTGGDPAWREAVFHGSVERYTRKWHGDRGWAVMRAAVLAGAVVRMAVGRGDTRDRARRRFALYRRGPAAEAARRGVRPAGGAGR